MSHTTSFLKLAIAAVVIAGAGFVMPLTSQEAARFRAHPSTQEPSRLVPLASGTNRKGAVQLRGGGQRGPEALVS